MKFATYPSILTDAQWKLIKPMLPAPKGRGRPQTDCRRIFDAILYVLQGGIQWRFMSASFPPWKTVYHVFRQWTFSNTWQALNARFRTLVRASEGK